VVDVSCRREDVHDLNIHESGGPRPAPAVEPAADACPADRLAAFLGRST
jgi:hypothetical protein